MTIYTYHRVEDDDLIPAQVAASLIQEYCGINHTMWLTSHRVVATAWQGCAKLPLNVPDLSEVTVTYRGSEIDTDDMELTDGRYLTVPMQAIQMKLVVEGLMGYGSKGQALTRMDATTVQNTTGSLRVGDIIRMENAAGAYMLFRVNAVTSNRMQGTVDGSIPAAFDSGCELDPDPVLCNANELIAQRIGLSSTSAGNARTVDSQRRVIGLPWMSRDIQASLEAYRGTL